MVTPSSSVSSFPAPHGWTGRRPCEHRSSLRLRLSFTSPPPRPGPLRLAPFVFHSLSLVSFNSVLHTGSGEPPPFRLLLRLPPFLLLLLHYSPVPLDGRASREIRGWRGCGGIIILCIDFLRLWKWETLLFPVSGGRFQGSVSIEFCSLSLSLREESTPPAATKLRLPPQGPASRHRAPPAATGLRLPPQSSACRHRAPPAATELRLPPQGPASRHRAPPPATELRLPPQGSASRHRAPPAATELLTSAPCS